MDYFFGKKDSNLIKHDWAYLEDDLQNLKNIIKTNPRSYIANYFDDMKNEIDLRFFLTTENNADNSFKLNQAYDSFVQLVDEFKIEYLQKCVLKLNTDLMLQLEKFVNIIESKLKELKMNKKSNIVSLKAQEINNLIHKAFSTLKQHLFSTKSIAFLTEKNCAYLNESTNDHPIGVLVCIVNGYVEEDFLSK